MAGRRLLAEHMVQPKPLYGLGIYTLEKSSDGRDVPVAFFPQHSAFREERPSPDGANEGSESTNPPAPSSDSQAKPGLSKSSGSIQGSNHIATDSNSAKLQSRYPPGDDKELPEHKCTSPPASPQAVASTASAPSSTGLPQAQGQPHSLPAQSTPEDTQDCTTPRERQRRPRNKLRKRPSNAQPT
ncbi:hypothetical protein KEM55_002879 [Ascosphaera atra]|nr:hypothetical protein KEM55_002879 [Ascosphaera atra]